MMQKLSFQWNIMNVDDCDLADNEFFDSSRFFISDLTFKSDWKLRLFPTSAADQKELRLELLRLDGGSAFPVKYSISILNRAGSRIETKSCDASKFLVNSFFPFVVFEKNKLAYMDIGMLSILCEIEIGQKSDETEGLVPEKHSQFLGTSYVVKNKYKESDLRLTVDENQNFFLPYGNLVVCLKGKISKNNEIFLKKIGHVHPEIEYVPLTIFDTKNRKTTCKINSVEYCTVRLSEELKSLVKISTRCMVESPLDASPITDLTSFMRKLQLDFRNMFSQSEFGDIAIHVGGKTIRVHKDVLSNRCPVFAAMFSLEWREQATQTVTITDFDYTTILAMIEFIYFGGRDDDVGEEAVDPAKLLKAAHQYQLDQLILKCEQIMCQRLENNYIDDWVALAYIYDLPNLKSKLFACMSNK